MASQELLERSDNACELCSNTAGLHAHSVAPHLDEHPDHQVLICETCETELQADPLNGQHWMCLQGSAWSGFAPVQVMAYRLLSRLSEPWALDLREQLYLEEETLEWAKDGLPDADAVATVDSNGATLADGDSVTLIKDLNVKGGGFTAKRGTLVKGIRLTDNPLHIEGRVNKQTIVLVTAYLKKA